MAAALAGGNPIYKNSGMKASLLGISLVALILDEMHSHSYRALRGIEVSEDNIGHDAIVDAVMGDGHFLGSPQTLAAKERDRSYPTYADREKPHTWTENARQIASERVREVLPPCPAYLTPKQDHKIRSCFNILLG